MSALLTCNPIFARSARWDRYGKTALELAEMNNKKACVFLLKQVREQSILANRTDSCLRISTQMHACTRAFVDQSMLECICGPVLKDATFCMHINKLTMYGKQAILLCAHVCVHA